MMHNGAGMGGWMMAFVALYGLLLWGLIVGGVVLLVRTAMRPDRPSHGPLTGPPAGPTPRPWI